MTRLNQTRDQRIDFRVTSEFKRLFQQAAEISGMNMTAFIIESARERALKLIEEQERFTLNNEARDALLNLLDNPPQPAEALRRAAEKYAVK